jgi:hypothetical protein
VLARARADELAELGHGKVGVFLLRVVRGFRHADLPPYIDDWRT